MACLSGLCDHSTGIPKWTRPYCIDPYEYVATDSKEIKSNQKLCRHGDEFIIMNSDRGIDYKGTWDNGKEKGEQYNKDGSVSYRGNWQHNTRVNGQDFNNRQYVYNRKGYPYLEDTYRMEEGDFHKGAFSDKAFKVTHKKDNKTYFAKQSSKEVKMLHHEYNILNNLRKCSHIIKADDFIMSHTDTNPTATLITELGQGGDLLDFINNKRVSKQKISVMTLSNFMYQLVTGLDCAHNNNIYHLDIKPQNIVFAQDPYRHPNPQLFYIDFGISVQDYKDQCTQEAGTEQFIAPEIQTFRQLELNNYKCSLADIYSLGVVFVYLYAITDDDPMFKQKKLEIKEEVVDRMLIKNPVDRISLENIKKSDWYTWYESIEREKEMSSIELEEKQGKSKRKYKKKYSKRK
jgi:hypothetical protein